MPPTKKIGTGRYEKNGKIYSQVPFDFLNTESSHRGQKRGEKLQQFLDDNGIDFDLMTGTGKDVGAIVCGITDRDERLTRIGAVYEFTNFEFNKIHKFNERNYKANERLTDSFRNSIYASRFFIYKPGETSPRIVYGDKDGNPKMTEPFDTLDFERMKPKKPGFFHTLAHKLNSNWYKDEFDKYERETRSYQKLQRELPDIRRFVEEENQRQAEARENAKTRANLIKQAEPEKESKRELDTHIDNLLGPHAEGDQKLIDLKIYKAETFKPNTLEYPENMPFSDHEVAMIGYAMLAQGDVAMARHEYCADKDMNVTYNYLHMTHDIFYPKRNRVDGDRTVAAFPLARDKARLLIEQYMNGNKEPLAKALGDSIKAQNFTTRSLDPMQTLFLDTVHATKGVWDLLNKDSELMKSSGLSEDDKTYAKGTIALSEIHDKMLEATAKLEKAADVGEELSNAELSECLDDIVLGKYCEKSEIETFGKFDVTKLPEFNDTMAYVSKTKGDIGKVKTKRGEYLSAKQSVPEELNRQFEEFTKATDIADLNMVILLSKRPTSSMTKLLGADNSEKKNYQDLLEKIKATNAYKELNEYTSKGLAKQLVSKDIDKKITDLKNETVDKEKENKKVEAVMEEKNIVKQEEEAVINNQLT